MVSLSSCAPLSYAGNVFFNAVVISIDHVGVEPESILSFDYLRCFEFLKSFIVGNKYQLA